METFLVRVWTLNGEEQPEGMRGTAVHLRSGLTVTYTEPATLLSFLADAAAAGDRDQQALFDGEGGDFSTAKQ